MILKIKKFPINLQHIKEVIDTLYNILINNNIYNIDMTDETILITFYLAKRIQENSNLIRITISEIYNSTNFIPKEKIAEAYKTLISRNIIYRNGDNKKIGMFPIVYWKLDHIKLCII